eukprot:6677861-Alexandrium_andersonii.AAC.1
MRTRPPRGGAGRQLVRKPTRRASSAPEALKRTCLQCASDGVLQGRLTSGANWTAEAAAHPPAFCAAILRGIA